MRASNWLSKGRRFEPQHRRFFTPNQWPPFPCLLLLASYTIGASFLRMSLASSQSTRFVKIGQIFEMIWLFHTRRVNYFNMYGLVVIHCRKCLIYTLVSPPEFFCSKILKHFAALSLPINHFKVYICLFLWIDKKSSLRVYFLFEY